MPKICTVLMADMIASRKTTGRAALARRLSAAMKKISAQHTESMLASLVAVKGIDEVGCVLKTPAAAYRICSQLNELMHPHLFRCAIAEGVIDVALGSGDISQMDGPAFHMAAQTLETAKTADEAFYRFRLSGDLDRNDTLSQLADLVQILKKDWTPRRRRIVDLYRQMGHQQKVARKLAITQQAVSDALIKAHYQKVRQVESLIDRLLSGQ